MLKRSTLAVFIIFIVWSILDFVIHGMLLQDIYKSTASLWRPMEEMNMTVMHLVTLAYAACFVVIYSVFVKDRSISNGLKFGLLFGLAAGISMGFGSYSYMPIPLSLALSWFAGTLVQSIIAGALVGTVMKDGKSN